MEKTVNIEANVERRESVRSETRCQAEERRDLEARYEDQEQRTAQLNAACRAIQSTPFRLIDSAFIVQILNTLSCKADEGNKVEIVDELDACAIAVALK
jgi:formiminotetrahydrofolate cyclodeaminase